MVVQHNLTAMNSNRMLGATTKTQAKSTEKLSSGYKINRAGDDAAGLSISESMRSQINGLDQAASNANDAIGLIQTAEGALTEVHSMLQRMTTLATQASNGTYNSVARTNIQKEVDALVAEIDRIAQNTDFNGIKPLSTDADKMVFQIGPSSAEKITVSKGDMTSTGISLSNAGGTNTSQLAIWNGVDNEDVTTANAAIDVIKASIDYVSNYRADLGAAQNRLEHTVNNLEVTSENITAAESRIRDTDMADEITAYTKNNILLQAAQSMLSQANAAPQGVLSLLQ